MSSRSPHRYSLSFVSPLHRPSPFFYFAIFRPPCIPLLRLLYSDSCSSYPLAPSNIPAVAQSPSAPEHTHWRRASTFLSQSPLIRPGTSRQLARPATPVAIEKSEVTRKFPPNNFRSFSRAFQKYFQTAGNPYTIFVYSDRPLAPLSPA